MWNKQSEFTAWLLEVKEINFESLPPWEEKKRLKDVIEDHNTGFQIMEKDGGAELGTKANSKPKNFSGSFGRKQPKTSKITSQSEVWTPATGAESASDLQWIEHMNLDEPEEKPALKTEEPEQRVEDDQAPIFKVVDKGVEFDDDMEPEKSDGTIGERSVEMKKQHVNDPQHIMRLTELDSIAKQIKALESMMKDNSNRAEVKTESPRLDEVEQTVAIEFLHLLENEEIDQIEFEISRLEGVKLNEKLEVEFRYKKRLYDLFVRTVDDVEYYKTSNAYDQGGIDQNKRFVVATKRYSESTSKRGRTKQETWEDYQAQKATVKFVAQDKKRVHDGYELVFDELTSFVETSSEVETKKDKGFNSRTVSERTKEDWKSLLIYAYRDELLKLIDKNQVLIIVGETESGKTTQIPHV